MSRKSLLELGNTPYISFATRKKSGEFVATPVWAAPGDDCLYVFSAGDAGKVKRLRNFSESRIAPCTATGKVTGEWLNTIAFSLTDPADKDIALECLHKKYGLKMRIGDFFSSLFGKKHRRAYIKIELPHDQ